MKTTTLTASKKHSVFTIADGREGRVALSQLPTDGGAVYVSVSLWMDPQEAEQVADLLKQAASAARAVPVAPVAENDVAVASAAKESAA